MGIDWEEILDAEGEDLDSAYTDSLPSVNLIRTIMVNRCVKIVSPRRRLRR